jgi:hypothetical protein
MWVTWTAIAAPCVQGQSRTSTPHSTPCKVIGGPNATSDWIARLRAEYSRFYAFQRELEGALASISP